MPTTGFKDHFSGHAADYAAYRPGYPPALFEYLASLPAAPSAGHRLAWDCGTGNGQAALGLAPFFDRIVATDPSEPQLAQAPPHPKIEYRAAPAEASGLPDHAVDLVTVAQALHWFDFDRFYAEVARVLAPGGALTAWTYNLARVDDALDPLIDRLAHDVVGPYWPPERRWVDEEYRTLPFPTPELPAPTFEHQERWDLRRLILYFRTWSAVKRCEKSTGRDPLAEVQADLEAAWGDPTAEKTVRWPIFLRAARL